MNYSADCVHIHKQKLFSVLRVNEEDTERVREGKPIFIQLRAKVVQLVKIEEKLLILMKWVSFNSLTLF